MEWKRRINVLLIFGGILLFSYSCKDKIVPNKHQVYKERIMYSCGVPAVNYTVSFSTMPGHGAWYEHVTTDENGYFKFINKHLGKPYRISKVDIYNLPNEDINDLGTLYLGRSISIVRRLKVV